jgi:hypothetical protein
MVSMSLERANLFKAAPIDGDESTLEANQLREWEICPGEGRRPPGPQPRPCIGRRRRPSSDRRSGLAISAAFFPGAGLVIYPDAVACQEGHSRGR